MTIFGKLIGGVLGYMMAGPMGMFIGLAVGHLFDSGLEINLHSYRHGASFAQKVFFSTTFEMMGYIAKADGRVSEREIQLARNVMAYLQLNHDQKMSAIKYFNLGKSPQFNWEATMDNFIKNCGHHPHLVQLFVEIQIQAAYADSKTDPYKHNALERLCLKLNIPQWVLRQWESRYANQDAHQHQAKDRGYSRHHPPPPPQQDDLQLAYDLLGISSSATAAEIKRAYRQLMKQNHPDKLMAKGLPEEMIKIATEKTQRIQKAYEAVCKAKGIR